jgi:hypothetical protein
MKYLKSQSNWSTLEVSLEEVLLLHQALNEVCNALDYREIETRMGFTRLEVLELITQLKHVREKLNTQQAK